MLDLPHQGIHIPLGKVSPNLAKKTPTFSILITHFSKTPYITLSKTFLYFIKLIFLIVSYSSIILSHFSLSRVLLATTVKLCSVAEEREIKRRKEWKNSYSLLLSDTVLKFVEYCSIQIGERDVGTVLGFLSQKS